MVCAAHVSEKWPLKLVSSQGVHFVYRQKKLACCWYIRCAVVSPPRPHLADSVHVFCGDGEVDGRVKQAQGVLDDVRVIQSAKVQLGRRLVVARFFNQPDVVQQTIIALPKESVAHQPDELSAEGTKGKIVEQNNP